VNSASPTPLAQSLRISTEHQRFSVENQTAAALHLFAEQNNFNIVKTYIDAGKSGSVLKHRLFAWLQNFRRSAQQSRR